VPVGNRAPTARAAMATPFDFNSHCHFDSEVTAAAIEGKDGAGAGWKPGTNG